MTPSTILSAALLAASAAALPASEAEPPVADALALTGECAAGDMTACIHLGVLHRRGVGAVQDARRALSLFIGACEQGYPLACAMVGDMTYLGEGVRANAAQGETLMRAACIRKNEWACETLRRHGLLKRRRAHS